MIDLEPSPSSPRVEGVTALLAELLAEEEEKRLLAQAAASPAVPCAPSAQELEAEDLAVRAAAAARLGLGRPLCEGTATPTSRQIADLSREMDACISSLEGWEGESERRREALKRELESAYGFSYQDTTSAVLGTLGHTADFEASLKVEDMPVDEASGRIHAASTRLASQHPDRFEPARGLLLRESPDVVQAEEDRIDRLRREVEEMRRQADCADPYGPGTGSPAVETPDVLQASCATTMGLSAWCAEVDAALAEEDLHRGESEGGGSMEGRGMRTMEGQLADAMKEVAGIEERYDQAQSQVNEEMADLDRLLAECNQVMGKMSSSAGSDA